MGEIFDYMQYYPKLTAIYSPSNEWPTDRYDYPFLARFPNLHFDLSLMMTDQGIEALVKEFGPDRLLYGSRFPEQYLGAPMLMIRHADISEADKEAIAGGNLCRLIREASL
jgi:predicted TIM-barrel fold metal-dependent hydrolase